MAGAAATATEAARTWKAGLPSELRHTTTRHGAWLFLRSASIYILVFLGAFLLPAGWMRGACLLITPMVITALFVIGHDAAHHTLTRRRGLNWIIGRLCMLPAYHPYTSWCHAHNGLHHAGTCLKGMHPDFAPLSKSEFDCLPAWRQRLERIYRAPLGVGLCYVLDFYRHFLLFPSGRNQSAHRTAFQMDRLLVLGFFGLQFLTGYALTAYTPNLQLPHWLYAAGAVALPWGIWIYFMGVFSFVQHTHPRTVWYDDKAEWEFYCVQLSSSTHMVLPWPLGAILHNTMDHAAHHIDPAIPLHQLPASQKLLEQQAPDYSLVQRLTWREYFRICRVCKLYDYRRHCWLNFEGMPTSKPRSELAG
jgi:acyl-lipid omega-6 desaturase (Delta-12 desaturase)